jgi:hypothetical protein
VVGHRERPGGLWLGIHPRHVTRELQAVASSRLGAQAGPRVGVEGSVCAWGAGGRGAGGTWFGPL